MLHIGFFSLFSALSIIVEYIVVLVWLPKVLRYFDALSAGKNTTSDTNNSPACEVSTEVDNGAPLTVDNTLLLLAATLHNQLAHLTETEVSTMLTELQFLKNTVGSHVPLFGNDEQDYVAPAHTFDKDAWHGDACLIEVMQWWLKRRSSEIVDEETENKKIELTPSSTGLPKEGTPEIIQSPRKPTPATPVHKGSEDITNFISGLEGWSSGSSSINQYCPDLTHTTNEDQPSSAYPPTIKPFNSAQQVIWHVSYSLDSELRDQPTSEIDDLMAKLRVHRNKTARKRDKAILSDVRNSAMCPDVPFAEKRASWKKVKIHWDAKVALVDGIMLIIRENFAGSENAVYEESFYGSSPAASVGSYTRSER
ncbi:hypothetical protein D6D03_03870 [Aureobasidium pullulans]|nr:hypothetical protein D6D03_03870 [Aureobasidium pullulans]